MSRTSRTTGWVRRATLGLISAGLAAALGCDSGGQPASREDTGREAPSYSAVTLEGDSVALAELSGAPVLLNVWATWCAPCRQEIPELQALHEEHADDGLRVVGVTVDSRSALENVRTFIDEFGMTYDVWLDPDQTALAAFGGMGVPLTVLIGPQGRIRWEHLGVLERDDPELREAISAVL